jgi:orotate phosphoribosyltransferase
MDRHRADGERGNGGDPAMEIQAHWDALCFIVVAVDGKAFVTMSLVLQDLTALHDILRTKSVRFGSFTLASGQTSDVYVDCRLTTCDPRAMPAIGRLFLKKMEEKGWIPQAVGGLTMGADPIAFAIARESLDRPPIIDSFVVRKEKKAHGMQKLVEGLTSTEGLKVVIVEDVCTKGESTALAIRNAKSAGMEILGAICLLDREAGGAQLLRAEFGVELASIFKLSDFRK